MGDKNNFYVMDDDYIERKYVQAEEERQRREEQERRQREIDEANAFLEAEKQRKAAEAERLRRQEEEDRMRRLEDARRHREEEDRKRKERDQHFQEKLKQIEKEMDDLDKKKADFVTDRLQMMRDINDGEAAIKNEIDEVLSAKRAILEKEQTLRTKQQEFEHKSRAQKTAFDQQEAEVAKRQRELTQQRRDVQNEMLGYLQNPTPTYTPAPPSETSFYQSPPSNNSFYPTNPAPTYQPQPQPMNTGFGYPMQTEPEKMAPLYPAQVAPVSAPAYVAPVVKKTPLEEQLEMLDSLLNEGIMTREEYEANKKEALKTAGVTQPPKQSGTGNAEVDKQLAQLDEYLRTGVLQKEDYEDAKARVLEDAKKKPVQRNVPTAPPASTGQSVILNVVVPYNKGPGDIIMINHGGKEFSVTVPQGIRAGGQFRAQVPV